jgi:hypothetical protein
MRAVFGMSSFNKDMNNLVQYSVGFLDGAQRGKRMFKREIGKSAVEMAKQFIDSNARVDPEALQHVYEWYSSGNPSARLYDIDYVVTGAGVSVSSTFRQSEAIQNGSNVPFYDKARIMEYGIPVRITPKRSTVLAFEQDGETVFTKGPVDVSNPGGVDAQGSFERVFNIFMDQYFSQVFLDATGLRAYLSRPKAFHDNIRGGMAGGKTVGLSAGYSWITKAQVDI